MTDGRKTKPTTVNCTVEREKKAEEEEEEEVVVAAIKVVHCISLDNVQMIFFSSF